MDPVCSIITPPSVNGIRRTSPLHQTEVVKESVKEIIVLDFTLRP
jgi:hypothetical protein